MTGRSFTPNDENAAHAPQQRSANEESGQASATLKPNAFNRSIF